MFAAIDPAEPCICVAAGFCPRFNRYMVGALYSHCQASVEHRRMFDQWRQDEEAQQAASENYVPALEPACDPPPCRFQGARLQNQVITGKLQVPVIIPVPIWHCDRLGRRCTPQASIPDVICCQTCPDYSPKNDGPAPCAEPSGCACR